MRNMFPKFTMFAAIALLAGCAGSNNQVEYGPVSTPTVDYIERLDVYSAPHKDSFLNQLAMNYRSYAIYNARTSGYSQMGELFANKAVSAFSGELPFPETLENWPVDNDREGFELHTAYNRLMEELKNDAADNYPVVAAEAQAKFDCWLSATASGQSATAAQCHELFEKAMAALDCDAPIVPAKVMTTTQTKTVAKTTTAVPVQTKKSSVRETYYPETRTMASMGKTSPREGVIVVNNVNIPEHLINPVPVQAAQPIVFNQNIYGGDKSISNSNNRTNDCAEPNCEPKIIAIEYQEEVAVPQQPQVQQPVAIPMIGEELVTREEFINMMMAMRSELAAINARLDKIQSMNGETTTIKVQQIPLEPKQHVMEEIFEVRFDFDKSAIKPEYEELIRKLVAATQENKNIKVSVVGHTDTSGSNAYNYALGGRRAEAVTKMLVKYGIPSSQIVAVSAGEKDLKVKTGDGVPNAENRRVQVIKETHYTEPGGMVPVAAVEVQEYVNRDCGMYGCGY
ncbi:OmpA family protein [Lachnospiraceae bacterium OttesenSCG-928-E19]|nr:OmpA family protein [Lachnospiraceae bacterium OttesenSCG-928-E19]